MPLANYSELKTEIENWLDVKTADITSADIVTLAEAEIKDRIRINNMFTTAQAETSTTDRDLALPTGFYEAVSIHFEEDPLWVMTQVTSDQINQFYISTAGKPRFYAINGLELEFDRVSDVAYTVELKYYKLDVLSDSNTTNDILTNYPDLYLYESLKAGAVYTQDDEILQKAMLMLGGDGTPKHPGIYKRIAKATRKAKYGGGKRWAKPRRYSP
jgi:hypothetical protein